MSRRGTLLPTHFRSAAAFGFAFAVASRARSAALARSQYVTLVPPGAVTVPSVTFSSAAGTPSFVAAAETRMSRASAHAKRTAVPLCSTDRLPAVWPSFGVRAVSPWTTSMRASSTSSSSAAICDSAVPMPCPSSILPVKTVTVPFGSMASHPLSAPVVLETAGQRGPARALSVGVSENPTTRAPVLMKSRREAVMTASPSRRAARRARCGCATRTGTGGRSAPAAPPGSSGSCCDRAAPWRPSPCRCRRSRTGTPAPR